MPGVLEPDANILDIGCGSGYLAAVFARLNPKAKVYGVDYIPELVQLSYKNLRKADGDLLDGGNIQLHTGNGWNGFAEGAPYSCIHVGAAAATLPRALSDQLKVGGKMIIPIGPDGGNQVLYLVERKAEGNNEEALKVEPLMGVRYVPLVDRN